MISCSTPENCFELKFENPGGLLKEYKVVLEPLVSPDLAIYIFKQVKVKMTLDLVMSP